VQSSGLVLGLERQINQTVVEASGSRHPVYSSSRAPAIAATTAFYSR
jgi:hypothetical protein